MSNAIAGVGTVFQRWNGSGWDTIAEINSITGPSMSRDVIDVTNLDSVGGYREFIAGFRKAGTVALKMNFTRDSYDEMLDDFESDEVNTYQIILPDVDSTYISFGGLVTELPLTIPADDKITIDVTIQVSGIVAVSGGLESEGEGSSIDAGVAYYVSTTGNDNNPGTIVLPFRTINKAASVVAAGETIYVRGGTYNSPAGGICVNLEGRANGTAGNLVKLFNYPGEVPIIDGINQTSAASGIELRQNYWHIRGFIVTNILEIGVSNSAAGGNGINAGGPSGANNNIIERCIVHHCEGQGINIDGPSDGNLILNCDTYDCWDRLTQSGSSLNSNSDGQHCWSTTVGAINTFRGCRAWWNGDDGFDFYNSNNYVICENCWSFWNGFKFNSFTPCGNGMGFKSGFSTLEDDAHYYRVYQECLAFENRTHGFDKPTTLVCKLINCTAYDNGLSEGVYQGANINIDSNRPHYLRNNIGYRATGLGAASNGITTHSEAINDHNSWNGADLTISDIWVSLDSTGMDGARQADGSLPVLTFMHLKSTSTYRDAGVDVGLGDGATPDLGCFQYP